MRRSKVEKPVQALTSWEEGLARLGECIIQLQRIEDGLSVCISAMVGKSRRVGEIITAEMSFRARVSVFGALFAHSLKAEKLPDDIQEEDNWTPDDLDDLNRTLEGIVTDLFFLTSEHLPAVEKRLWRA